MNQQPNAPSEVAKIPRLAWRAGPLLLLAVLAAMLMYWQSLARRDAPPGRPTGATTVLSIDPGTGDPVRREVPHRVGMTVFDQLRAAAADDATLTFESRGSGEATFVTAINERKNEGAAEADNNWLYRVNGEKPHQSCALVKLEPGDAVLWKFGPYE